MKREKVIALILEARRQGDKQADRMFRQMLEKANGRATIEALQAEVARLTAENDADKEQQVTLIAANIGQEEEPDAG